MTPTVTVVVTTHNRREKTVACLEALKSQSSVVSGAIKMAGVLVDAGSSDGTAEAVEQTAAWVRVIRTTADVYWAEGMRIGNENVGSTHFRLWMNDDVLLYEDGLERLLSTIPIRREASAIAVGSTRDPDSGETTYGGFRREPNRMGLRLVRIEPQHMPLPGDTFNANAVLITEQAYQDTGNISRAFRHSLGDLDFGLRATKRGVPVYVAPGYVGSCSNDHVDSSTVGLVAGLRRLRQPTGQPIGPWALYTFRHSGAAAPIDFLRPLLGLLRRNR